MSNEVIMPKMGESIVEGTIIDWKKNIGDYVEKDEILLEISTDKVDSEIPSPVEGKLIKILYEKNDTVEVGKVIAYVGDDDVNVLEEEKIIDIKENEDEDINISSNSSENTENSSTKNPLVTKKVEQSNPDFEIKNMSYNDDRKKFFSPLVRKIAKEKNISLAEMNNILGTGLNGRVSKNDLLNFISSDQRNQRTNDSLHKKDTLIKDESVLDGSFEEMSRVQRIVASHMKDSLAISPHVYSNVEEMLVWRSNVYQMLLISLVNNQHLHEMGHQKSSSRFD